MCNFNGANEFFSISKLFQNRKDKIQSTKSFEDITKRFLFSLFDTSTTSQIIETVCEEVLFLIEVDCFSLIIVT